MKKFKCQSQKDRLKDLLGYLPEETYKSNHDLNKKLARYEKKYKIKPFEGKGFDDERTKKLIENR